MKSIPLSAVAFLLLGVSAARGDVVRPPPPPPPKPPSPLVTEPDIVPVVAGAVAAVGLVFAGIWLVRARRQLPGRS